MCCAIITGGGGVQATSNSLPPPLPNPSWPQQLLYVVYSLCMYSHAHVIIIGKVVSI